MRRQLVEPIVRQEGLGRSSTLSFSESSEHLCAFDVSRSDLAHRVGDAACSRGMGEDVATRPAVCVTNEFREKFVIGRGPAGPAGSGRIVSLD